ncbi:baseplate J/gp47 family protein [Nocardioides sp. SR21]|uniref:baseplate J/gp47 family protein n=1 Tax=Nocardioides sp. SR21 TaxID=2919501 RepID=UPI001FAB2FD2|nr:baseplate J/gp47 family protein [Nocardioides sp. SR21]
MTYEPPDLPADPDAVSESILEGMADQMPGWVPVDGAPEVALAEEVGTETAATRAFFTSFAEWAVAGFGATVFGVQPVLAAAAQLSVEFTVTGAGAQIPVGFTVIATNESGAEIAFITSELLTSVSTTVTATLTAAVVGTVGNDVPAGDLVVATASAVVTAAEATAPSAGGLDDEPIADYLVRLSDQLATLSFGGILPHDLALLARSVPGVDRAVGLDNYDALSGLTDVARTVTVFVVDEDGAPVSVGIKADVQDVLQAAREPNLVIYVADPTYTSVDIAYEAVADPDANPVTVKTAVDAALAAYIARWGSTSEDPDGWVISSTMRLFEVVSVIGSVAGVLYLDSLTLNGAAADLALAGVAALPTPVTAGVDPSTITGTVV